MTTEQVQKVDQAGDRAGDVQLVPLSSIKVDEKINVRTIYEGIESLAAQIKHQGLLTPLTVDQGMKLVAGFRRKRALDMLFHDAPETLIKVTVKQIEAPSEIFLLNLGENTGRENISDYDLAKRLSELEAVDGKFGIKRAMIEKATGMSKTAVGKHITTWNGICAKVRKAWNESSRGELADVDGKLIELPTQRVHEMSKKDEKTQHKMLEAFLDHDRAEVEPDTDGEGDGGGDSDKGGEVVRAPKRKEIKEQVERLEEKKKSDDGLDDKDTGRLQALRWVLGLISRPY